MVDKTGTKGNDVITGSATDDYIDAGKGNDLVRAGDGADDVFGGAGDDILFGEDGDDYLVGGIGSDYLAGGAGNDELKGSGGGRDTLIGGTGSDQFVFRSGEGGAAMTFGYDGYSTVSQWTIIGDLNFGEGDFIRLTGFAPILDQIDGLFSGGSYFIDSQDDIDALAAVLDANPSLGSYFEVDGGPFDSTTFVLLSEDGTYQALALNGVHPSDVVPV